MLPPETVTAADEENVMTSPFTSIVGEAAAAATTTTTIGTTTPGHTCTRKRPETEISTTRRILRLFSSSSSSSLRSRVPAFLVHMLIVALSFLDCTIPTVANDHVATSRAEITVQPIPEQDQYLYYGTTGHHVQDYVSPQLGTVKVPIDDRPDFLYSPDYPNGRVVEFYAHWCRESSLGFFVPFFSRYYVCFNLTI